MNNPADKKILLIECWSCSALNFLDSRRCRQCHSSLQCTTYDCEEYAQGECAGTEELCLVLIKHEFYTKGGRKDNPSTPTDE